jgi:hypothetical protein
LLPSLWSPGTGTRRKTTGTRSHLEPDSVGDPTSPRLPLNARMLDGAVGSVPRRTRSCCSAISRKRLLGQHPACMSRLTPVQIGLLERRQAVGDMATRKACPVAIGSQKHAPLTSRAAAQLRPLWWSIVRRVSHGALDSVLRQGGVCMRQGLVDHHDRACHSLWRAQNGVRRGRFPQERGASIDVPSWLSRGSACCGQLRTRDP